MQSCRRAGRTQIRLITKVKGLLGLEAGQLITVTLGRTEAAWYGGGAATGERWKVQLDKKGQNLCGNWHLVLAGLAVPNLLGDAATPVYLERVSGTEFVLHLAQGGAPLHEEPAAGG